MNISRVGRATCAFVLNRNLYSCSSPKSQPQHLICFKQWTAEMVKDVIKSAIGLKCIMSHPEQCPLTVLKGKKIMTLQEVNQPMLSLAVSKAATLLGADDVSVTDELLWEQDYKGRIFSYMSDAIFVSTATHMCLQRFADNAHVPVLCMQSRTHATIQALATVMAIVEEYGTMRGMNVGWLGPAHPVLNSYLLLCPMLGANIKYKCCCKKLPVSPLLKKASEEMGEKAQTHTAECSSREEVIKGARVLIAGPTTKKPENLQFFRISVKDMEGKPDWTFFHTLPRGKEVDDELFNHCQTRTYAAFENLHFVAAALMAFVVNRHTF